MTLIIAIKCKDGVVIAADSASTDVESGSKQPYEKIRQLGNEPILYGGSGDGGLLQDINESLKRYAPKHSLKEIRKEIKRLIIPEIQEARQSHVSYPMQPFNLPPPAILLFAGVTQGTPWILESERDGRQTLYGDDLGNFCAIGSGKPWAQATFRSHLATDRDLQLGKIFACRVMDDSIKLAAAYLAKPIHIYTISQDGTISSVDDVEFNSLNNTCESWRELERETVGELLAPQYGEREEPEVPQPEQAVQPT